MQEDDGEWVEVEQRCSESTKMFIACSLSCSEVISDMVEQNDGSGDNILLSELCKCGVMHIA